MLRGRPALILFIAIISAGLVAAVEVPHGGNIPEITSKFGGLKIRVKCAMKHGYCEPDMPTTLTIMRLHEKDIAPFGEVLYRIMNKCSRKGWRSSCEKARCMWRGTYCQMGDNDPDLNKFAAKCSKGDSSQACIDFMQMVKCSIQFSEETCQADRHCNWRGKLGCKTSRTFIADIIYGKKNKLRRAMDHAMAFCEEDPFKCIETLHA